MKVILFMVQTVNGKIARNNYSEDFLSHENWLMFKKEAEKSGAFVWGRKTFEEVSKWPAADFLDFKSQCIVLARSKDFVPPKKVIKASSTKEVLAIGKKLGFKTLIITGGGIINSLFMKENLIDEIMLNIEPFVLGDGISLFAKSEFENKLELTSVKKFKSGIVQLRYKVKK